MCCHVLMSCAEAAYQICMLARQSTRKLKMASPDSWGKLKETRKRLQKCWGMDLDWSLFPKSLQEVRCNLAIYRISLIVASFLPTFLLQLYVFVTRVVNKLAEHSIFQLLLFSVATSFLEALFSLPLLFKFQALTGLNQS